MSKLTKGVSRRMTKLFKGKDKDQLQAALASGEMPADGSPPTSPRSPRSPRTSVGGGGKRQPVRRSRSGVEEAELDSMFEKLLVPPVSSALAAFFSLVNDALFILFRL